MTLSIISKSSESITSQVTIPFTCYMLHSESIIQDLLIKYTNKQTILNNQSISWSSSNSDINNVLDKQIVKEETKSRQSKKEREKKQESLDAAITYFTNNITASRMNYAASVVLKHPIGSGVTEAPCKTIVKQRLGQSDMKWKNKGAGVILSLRALFILQDDGSNFGRK